MNRVIFGKYKYASDKKTHPIEWAVIRVVGQYCLLGCVKTLYVDDDVKKISAERIENRIYRNDENDKLSSFLRSFIGTAFTEDERLSITDKFQDNSRLSFTDIASRNEAIAFDKDPLCCTFNNPHMPFHGFVDAFALPWGWWLRKEITFSDYRSGKAIADYWVSGLVNICESGARPWLWVKKDAIGLN